MTEPRGHHPKNIDYATRELKSLDRYCKEIYGDAPSPGMQEHDRKSYLNWYIKQRRR
jgi:hypothetical protein